MNQVIIHGDAKRSVENTIKDMLKSEYQFRIETENDSALIAFHKGCWDIKINTEDIVCVSDSCEVVKGNLEEGWLPFDDKNEMSLTQAFIQCRIEIHEGENFTNPWRDVPAEAIYDFLKLRLHLDSIKTFSIFVRQAGRDGLISQFSM